MTGKFPVVTVYWNKRMNNIHAAYYFNFKRTGEHHMKTAYDKLRKLKKIFFAVAK